MEEESYKFRASKYVPELIAHYEKNLKGVMPRVRYNEVMSLLRDVQDQSVSRSTLKWGIPIPGDEQHVIYVWFDALVNYAAAVGYLDDRERFDRYWPCVRHLVGKDIIRFHCITWPLMLIALGLNPPVSVISHGWWTVDGEKMSKSKGNVVDPFDMAGKYGVDAFRYFLLREVPFGLDGDFSERALVGRINSDLANDLGNLLNRTLQMIVSYCGGIAPAAAQMTQLDEEIKALAESTLQTIDAYYDDFSFDEILKSIWVFIRRGNKYIDETSPWRLSKEGDTERLRSVLSCLYEVLRFSALMIAPFMPETASRIWTQLGLPGEPAEANLDEVRWLGRAEVPVHKGDVLFPRIDLNQWEAERRR
jgi:methionyl-tRNA synthetase